MAVAIANDLLLDSAGLAIAYTQELPTTGASKVTVETILQSLSATDVTSTVQFSNDRVNWKNSAIATAAMTSAPDKKDDSGAVEGWAFVRVEHKMTGTGKALLTSSLSTGS